MIILENSAKITAENVLKAMEYTWNFGLPKSYRNFLKEKNGGYYSAAFNFKENMDGSILQAFLGLDPDPNLNLLNALKTYKKRIPSACFPIAYDTFGNLILIMVKGPERGKIYFWDHEEESEEGEEPTFGNMSLIADSFDSFLDGLYDPNTVTLE